MTTTDQPDQPDQPVPPKADDAAQVEADTDAKPDDDVLTTERTERTERSS